MKTPAPLLMLALILGPTLAGIAPAAADGDLPPMQHADQVTYLGSPQNSEKIVR
ncbi:hypothetical protein [Burkholderia vietnamiensis]|uniref:hypothetical protein n=1 Tax=Burkholderia vietnamiensis TaxID=60552 RepID=UPI002013A67B|nr:hypothetical protein [Burkholderia vietnamiensis]